MAGPADHWPPTVGAFWFHYWFEFWLQFWAASIAAQRAAYLGAQLGAKAVDMMDNADALTTCPQQQQQTESLAA